MPRTRRLDVADSGTAAAGVPDSRDALSIIKHHGVANNYADAVLAWYASPPDVWGRGADRPRLRRPADQRRHGHWPAR